MVLNVLSSSLSLFLLLVLAFCDDDVHCSQKMLRIRTVLLLLLTTSSMARDMETANVPLSSKQVSTIIQESLGMSSGLQMPAVWRPACKSHSTQIPEVICWQTVIELE